MREKEVFWFDVSMNDLFFVNIVNSLANLFDDRTYILLFHSTDFFQDFEEVAVWAEFHEEIDIGLVFKVAIQGCYVPVGKVELDAKFTSNLSFVLLLFYLLL